MISKAYHIGLGSMLLVMCVLVAGVGWRNASLENTNAELIRDRNEWVEKYAELEKAMLKNITKPIHTVTQTITEYVPEYITETVIEYVPEYITEYVDVPVYPELRNFESLDELCAWNDSWEYTWQNTDGVTQFGANGNNDCDDRVIQWVQDAVNAGYFAGFGIDTERGHLVASVIIGNDYYFIDPSTDEIFVILNNSYWMVD